MKNHFKLCVASILFTSVSSAALAADFPEIETAPSARYDWSGGYFGVQAGGALSGGVSAITTVLGVPVPPLVNSPSENGFLVGTFGGYNFQRGNVVFGFDNDFSFTNLDYNLGNPPSLELNTLSTARLRIGYAFDRLLPYVTGGLAYSFADFQPAPGGGFISDNNVDFGWTVGAGLEYAVTDNIRIRGQYTYIDLGENNFDDLGVAGVGLRTDDHEIHAIRAGVSITTRAILNAFRGN